MLRRLLGGPRGSVVLLVGPCDAGKTTLFHQLVDGSTHLGTVASMQANEAAGPLASEKVGNRQAPRALLGTRAGDPAAPSLLYHGSPAGAAAPAAASVSHTLRRRPPARLCAQAAHPGARPVTLVDVPGHPRVRGAMQRYADRAAGVVFVVDSVDFMPRKTEAAE